MVIVRAGNRWRRVEHSLLMCGRTSTTGYDDIVGEVLQTVLLDQASADGERTNSVEVLCERPKRAFRASRTFLVNKNRYFL